LKFIEIGVKKLPYFALTELRRAYYAFLKSIFFDFNISILKKDGLPYEALA